MKTSTTKVPKWFFITIVLLLVWNLMGIINFFSQINMTEENIALLPVEQQKFYTEFTLIPSIAFALGVFGGALGCLGLLLKKPLSIYFFWISLVGILVQTSHNLSIDTGEMRTYIISMALLLVVVTFISIFLAKKGIKNNWI
jgi:hypothetical protein